MPRFCAPFLLIFLQKDLQFIHKWVTYRRGVPQRPYDNTLRERYPFLFVYNLQIVNLIEGCFLYSNAVIFVL